MTKAKEINAAAVSKVKKCDEYSVEQYIGFINHLLEKMNTQQLYYILANVNQIFCGGYFTELPVHTKQKNAVKDIPDIVSLEASVGDMFFGVKRASVLLECLVCSVLGKDIPESSKAYKMTYEAISSGLEGILSLLNDAEISGQDAMDIIDQL